MAHGLKGHAFLQARLKGERSCAHDGRVPLTKESSWPRRSTAGGVRNALRTLRVISRVQLGRILAARLPAPRTAPGALAGERISSVLICRLNARMGNALFLTPLIQQVRELLPRATIDVAIAYPQADDLLGQLPGVRRVITFPYKGVQMVWRYLLAVARVRARHYDLAIDPMPNSTGGRIILSVCRARFRLGFASNHQWVRLTHAVPVSEASAHRAIQPVFLLHQALGVTHEPGDVRLWNPFDSEERAEGRQVIARALEARGIDPVGAQTVGFFAHATGLKSVDREYWGAFWAAFLQLAPEAVPVEFLPTPDSQPMDPRFASLHVRTPRRLAAALAEPRMFISADTGPMHLASSTWVPTVALFRASDPALYGPLKPCDLALDIKQYSPRALAQICHRHWQSQVVKPAAAEHPVGPRGRTHSWRGAGAT
jgi:heptosyltransferase III